MKGKYQLSVDDFSLIEIICEEMYKFFNKAGVSWLYHLKDRKKDPHGFMYNRFRIPAKEIVMRIREEMKK